MRLVHVRGNVFTILGRSTEFGNKYEVIKGSGTNALHHCDTCHRVAIYEDMFRVILNAHVGMGHA